MIIVEKKILYKISIFLCHILKKIPLKKINTIIFEIFDGLLD